MPWRVAPMSMPKWRSSRRKRARKRSRSRGTICGPGGILQRLATSAEYEQITDPHPAGSFGDFSGRPQVPCAQIAALKPAVILVAGQSNAANTAERDHNGQVFRTDKPIYNLLFVNSTCYRAENPLLGADGTYQSFALPLASQLIDANIFGRVLIVPISVSGTMIEEWTPSGHYWSRFTKAIASLDEIGLRPDFVVWHQGEGNAGFLTREPDASQTLKDALWLAYIRNFLSIVDGLRSLGVAAPVFVAVATGCSSTTVSPHIRAAQLALPDLAWKIYQGPDTDMIDFSYRSRANVCHFSHEGNQVHAEKWYEILRAYLAANPRQSRLTPESKCKPIEAPPYRSNQANFTPYPTAPVVPPPARCCTVRAQVTVRFPFRPMRRAQRAADGRDATSWCAPRRPVAKTPQPSPFRRGEGDHVCGFSPSTRRLWGCLSHAERRLAVTEVHSKPMVPAACAVHRFLQCLPQAHLNLGSSNRRRHQSLETCPFASDVRVKGCCAGHETT